MRYKVAKLNGSNKINEYSAPSFVWCKPPLNLETVTNAEAFTKSKVPHHYSDSHYSGQPFVAEIDNGFVATCQGLIFDKENFYEESYHNRELLDTIIPIRPYVSYVLADGTVDTAFKDFISDYDEPMVTMVTPHAANYHHWILEFLPKFFALDAFPELRSLPLLIPMLTKDFQTETLLKVVQRWGDVEFKHIILDKVGIRSPKLIFPSFLAPGGHSLQQLEWLRDLFLPGDLKKPHRRIYISRKDATNPRSVLNEGDVLTALEPFGFEEVQLSKLTHADQVRLFGEACIIVGASGAGFTNHIFSPIGAHILEFHSEQYSNRCHYFTSNILEQTYQFVIGEDDGDGNMTVPINEIVEAVQRVL